MSKRRRLLLGYSLFGACTLAACTALAVYAAGGARDPADLGITDEFAAAVPADAPLFSFEAADLDFVHFPGKRTRRLPEDMGSGAAMEDFDGDGLLDLFLVNSGPLGEDPPPPCALFRNLGDSSFERVDTELPVLHGMGVAAADYDADGDFDLYITGYGRNVLLRNDGGMRFTDITRDAGVEGGGFSAGACWGDADGDSDLDLYVCRYVEFDESMEVEETRRGRYSLPATLNPSAFDAQANLLFRNDGGRFTEIAAEAGVANAAGKSLGAMFCDMDGDGVLDLYVANDVSDNALLRARRGAPFADDSHAAGVADWRGAMGLAAGDFDVDGDLDFFLTHWLPEENALYERRESWPYREASLSSLLGPAGRGLVGWACEFADLDSDGRPDVYVVNGSTFEEPDAPTRLVPQLAQLFWNAGGRFFDRAALAGPALQRPFVGRGGVSGDLDGDGDLDLLLVRHGESPLLLRNETPQGGHLFVEVRGSLPNRFAYGAVVTVEAGGARQAQIVGAKVTYLGSGPHVLHFGLGGAAASRVVVRFPSGAVVERRGSFSNTRVVVDEVDPRTLGTRMDAARDALVAGRLADAEAVLRDVLRLSPRHTGALYELAMLAEPSEALALCDALLREEPLVPRGHLLRAKILSDPASPERMDLPAALREVSLARRLNRDESGGLVEEGRIRLLLGDLAEAASVLERVPRNPYAAALAAVCRFRLADAPAARRLLGLAPEGPDNVAEEGDTEERRAGARHPLAEVLLLPAAHGWRLERVHDARFAPAPLPPPRATADLIQFALDPPASCAGAPEGLHEVGRFDFDGDGDFDLVLAPGDDPAAPLPWWLFVREGDGWRPLRGALPRPAFRLVGAAVQDGAVVLVGEGGETWTARR